MAKSHYEESLPFLGEYKSKGQNAAVDNILKSVNLNDVLINKQREIVEKFLKYEAVKKDAFFNIEDQPKLALVEQKIASCIPVFEQYEELGPENTAQKISGIIQLGEAQKAKFISEYQVDVRKSLSKDLEKADNRQLTYMMMIFFAIFGVVYLYVEV